MEWIIYKHHWVALAAHIHSSTPEEELTVSEIGLDVCLKAA